MSGLLWDVRYALRMLRRNPGFTVVAVAMLAVGIGVNAAVFNIANSVLFKGFPGVVRNDRLLYLSTGRGCCVSWPDFVDWRAQAKSFSGMAVVHGFQRAFSGPGGSPETSYTTEVSANTFRLVGQLPAMGRDFTPEDESPGAPSVAILSYGFWERRFGRNPAAIGASVRIDGKAATVIGVMPRGFSFPQSQDLWTPLIPTAEQQNRGTRDLWFAIGRLADGATLRSTRTEMEIIGRRLGAAFPLTNQDRNLIPRVQTFREFFIGPNATTVYEAMLGAVGFVLLIACANLANLLLGRAIGRSREIAVRVALGAGRWRIMRQFLIESAILSALGGFFGWWIAQWGMRIYALRATGPGLSDSIAGTWFDNVLNFNMDAGVFAWLVAISAVTGLLFGLAPARTLAKLDVNTPLKEGARGATGGMRGRQLSALLVALEMALTVVLLSGAGVMIRSFLKVYDADLGAHIDHTLVKLLFLPKERYPDMAAQISFFDRLKSRLETLPGVESLAFSGSLPSAGVRRVPFETAGSPQADAQRRAVVGRVVIGPEYFQTLGTRVHAGRDFNDVDGPSAAPVTIVNELFAAQNWPGENAVGKRLQLFDGNAEGRWLTVAGVAPNIVQNDNTRQRKDPLVYVPWRQTAGGSAWVIARTRVDPASLANAFRHEVNALDPDMAIVIGPVPMEDFLASGYQYRGTSGVLFLVFAAIALLLAAIGLYAVIAHSVSQRTQEIGIRTAMGATSGHILGLVFRQGLMPLAGGLAIGLAGSVAVNRALKSALIQVSPADPATLAGVIAAVSLAAALGCWIPARRAISVDPVNALRHE